MLSLRYVYGLVKNMKTVNLSLPIGSTYYS